MERTVVKIWTLIYSIYIFTLPMGVNGVIRRQFFPESFAAPENGFGDVVSSQGLQNHASKKYCTEPCTTMVLDATALCHSCMLAHPHIPRYMEMIGWQLVSDVLIALAYFSIPVELLFFIYKAQVFPYKWVVVEFGAFIVLCGLTHLTNVWTFTSSSADAVITMTLFKVSTAFVSCATAVTLSWVIPEVLSVKKRELFLAVKTAELDKQVGAMKEVEETGKHVRMLTHEIRSTLNRHTILKTTLVELAQTLKLKSCNIWMPSADAEVFELTHELDEDNINPPTQLTVPRSDACVQKVLSSPGAMLASPDSIIAMHNCPKTTDEAILQDRVVAVRLPCMSTSHFKDGIEITGGSGNQEASSYALLVLVLPCDPKRKWHNHELDLVTAVADQVAVALSHATVLEESMRARDQLMSQNLALEIARIEAEEAVAARNDFLTVMNHEMRTPMHALIALTSILLQTDLTEDQHSMVETMAKSSSLLLSLINDILDFSRLESGGLALDISPFDLPNLMREVEKIVRPLAISKQISLTMSMEPDMPQNALGDSNRILQVMLNVIGNAIKFTLEGEVKILVRLGESSDFRPVMAAGAELLSTPNKVLEYRYLHVDVQDTGIGIKALDVPRLFYKFVQADSTTTRNFGGTGLGLAISRKFLELMGGRIWLESEGLGKGTTCKMYMCIGIYQDFKQVPAGPGPRSPGGKSSVPSELKDLKVMVVDDNSINRVVTRRLLDNIGCRSTVLDSGQKCLDVLAEKGHTEFQIILLDLCMPEMDGFHVATEIREKFGRVGRPVIAALTANSDTKTRERCFEVGMDYVLMKPINLTTLKTELTKLLEIGHHIESPPQLQDKEAPSSVAASPTTSPEPPLQLPPDEGTHS